MNEFVPRGYLTLKKALEHFGKLKHADKWEAKKASNQQEFQQFLFEETVPAEHFIGGKLTSLESSIWGREAESIFASGWATIHGGNEYFPATVHGPVLIKQSSIDALFEELHSGSHSLKAKLRSKLKLWLGGLDEIPVLTKTQCLEAAQLEFETPISMNIFNEAWRDAKLPKTWRASGRRRGT